MRQNHRADRDPTETGVRDNDRNPASLRRPGSMLCEGQPPSHLRFCWTGSHFTLACQPVAAVLTEFLQCEVIIKERPGAAGAPVTIFHRSWLEFGRPTGRIFHPRPLLYALQNEANSFMVHQVGEIAAPSRLVKQRRCHTVHLTIVICMSLNLGKRQPHCSFQITARPNIEPVLNIRPCKDCRS